MFLFNSLSSICRCTEINLWLGDNYIAPVFRQTMAPAMCLSMYLSYVRLCTCHVSVYGTCDVSLWYLSWVSLFDTSAERKGKRDGKSKNHQIMTKHKHNPTSLRRLRCIT